ncbi:calponin homology domain-containing protein DDB_G0272472 isoform X3 [Spodoptera litura]|uniref:Calponin homology domain-containing protein DDB_G0272472 isoform X3 n=1 Tax=Spodoptera litura TaxID=69820 RepID=A0A9J7J0R2_SPOLT|nr:calponin homology domain-containing protein DDB_G0272472 isoform X3 [Spodoptera litura]
MEEVRQLVQEEGREARNLVAFHVAVDQPSRISRKPPRSGAPPPRRATPRAATRLRSASAGRDKRSELRARYWALLFGDLQRAIGEIYNTVEAHENLNECQEVILVLENYTRDFKALGEWFRLKWEYDNTPPPQRPQSLAWEIRKTDFVRPESRKGYSVKSSPSVSGKNSPCLSGHNTPSGKNSPNLTGKASPGSGKVSPRVTGHSSNSPKANIEFFSNKIASKITTKPEPKSAKDISRLSDIKEKEIKDIIDDNDVIDVITPAVDKEEKLAKEVIEKDNKLIKGPVVEIGKARECPNTTPKMVVIKSPKRQAQEDAKAANGDISSQAKATVAKLDAMENEFLAKQLNENAAKNENQLNLDKESDDAVFVKPAPINIGNLTEHNKIDDEKNKPIDENSTVDEKISISSVSPVKSEDNFGDVSNDSSKSSDDKTSSSDDKYDVDKVDVKESASETNQNDIQIENVTVKDQDNKYDDTKEIDITKVGENPDKDTQEKDGEVKDKKDHDPKKIDLKNASEKPSTRPAYSQAAAKPKPVTTPKTEVKTPTRLIARSKTVVEMRPNSASKAQRPFQKRNQTSKCSYPFNLTTGRTSLFDAPSNKVVSKKPPIRAQMGSGDSKNTAKLDVKKRPPRPSTLKINEKGDKTEKVNPSFDKKEGEEFSSSDTIVTQIDMSRIESSESLKTLVPEEGDFANSIEVLNVDNAKSDNDGWLTVKSRRLSRESKKQSKSHWANRFHQPSATTSLPTLNMIESPKQEVKEIVSASKLDRAKSEQPQNKPEKPKIVKPKPDATEAKKDLSIIRQKSDVTGLKTRTSRSKALKREKVKDTPKDDGSELTKNRLHSSLESLTTGLARSQEKTEEKFDFDKWKSEFMSTFKFLEDDDQMNEDHKEILKTADPSEMSEIAEMTSQIEENERKISLALDFLSVDDERKLCEEEDLLNRQIMELQQVSDIDLDTETDDTETDAEILCEDASAGVSCQSTENLSLAASLEDQYETALAGMSWAERVDTLGALEALVARDPGRAQQLHAKLSQGIKRRGSLQDALRRLQLKQARAERQRIEYQTERARKIHQLLARVEEVKVAKNELIEEKRNRMERRLQKAAANRDQHLKDIVRKAHDEEEKLREIAFIKQLEAENRRHEFLDQCRSHNTRLRQMRRDRLSKLEQKAAREAAVGARRQALEAARKLHVETLLEKRKERDARVEELKELKKQERDDAAREKAQGVKSRLSALAAAAELEADALRSRIRDKQDRSQLRLESHLQAIREKATTGPRQPTTSESQDQMSKEEKELQEETQRLEQERKDREKQKAIKKKARKVKQKLLTTSNDTVIIDDASLVDVISPTTTKVCKVIHQLSHTLEPFLEHPITFTIENENITQENGFDPLTKKRHRIIINGGAKNTMEKEDKDKSESKEKEKEVKKEKKIVDKENKGVDKKNNGDEKENKEKDNKVVEKENKENDNKAAEKEIKGEENESTSSGKKKKKKNDKDKPKLSKTSSVCSSLSDMSKSSGKNEKPRTMIDMQSLEKQLNEVHRTVEKCAKMTPKDRTSLHKIHLLKVLGEMLCIACDREDITPQFTTKALNTAVVAMGRAVSSCNMSARYFLSTRAAIYVVKLLSMQLEKDLQANQREMDLAMQLSDCLSVVLDGVLCSSRLYNDGKKDNSKEESEMLSTLRGRAHMLISYLCLTGCITRAEKAGAARESIQTLLTVCADLCHPCEVDAGSERIVAAQSLRCALGTGIAGSRAEFCMLFAQGAGLEHSGGFVKAARTAHLLRTLAELDHMIVQDAFGEGGWPLEFRAAVARLLSQHAPTDKEAPRTTALRKQKSSKGTNNQRLDQTLSETMVLDLIVLVGFVVVNNPQLQETICDGWSVIKTLCTLPANWLVSKPQSDCLLPTLVALSELPAVASAMSSELSMQMLQDYMKSPCAQKIKLVQVIKQGRTKKGKNKDK